MKIILVGYPGSQFLVPATRHLIEKYMPNFKLVFLNYEGDIKEWSNFIADYLDKIEDDKVIFTLDDYLLSAPIDMYKFGDAFSRIGSEVVCAKLCDNTPQEFEEYPVTTQYTIWNRKFLIELLRQTTDPWDFEINGSAIFKQSGKQAILTPCMKYNVHTALSKRWQGVSLKGLSYEDVLTVKGLLS